jgi:hypothetical protein
MAAPCQCVGCSEAERLMRRQGSRGICWASRTLAELAGGVMCCASCDAVLPVSLCHICAPTLPPAPS